MSGYKSLVLKTRVGDEPAVGSNPTASAILQRVKGTATGIIAVGSTRYGISLMTKHSLHFMG